MKQFMGAPHFCNGSGLAAALIPAHRPERRLSVLSTRLAASAALAPGSTVGTGPKKSLDQISLWSHLFPVDGRWVKTKKKGGGG